MTSSPEDRPPEEPRDQTGRPLDEDAAWADIVAHYGERPRLGDREPEPGVFDRTYLDAVARQQEEADAPAAWADEGHFVPPPPPPLPVVEPRRRAAWAGLFGAPLLMLVGVVFGWDYPTWLSALLVAAFVGGFVYLVATMRNVPRDPWSGDDGAVV